MTTFTRCLKNLEVLEGLKTKPQWWIDLLSLWRPSGVDADTHGLRLAIRNNYMNFYRLGQSVARIEIGSDGIPTARTHIKYVKGESDRACSRDYLRLSDDGFYCGDVRWKRYSDVKTWHQIIVAAEGKSGDEKKFVDELVKANSNIIDLEMALPAWKEQPFAPRMDIVAIEQAHGTQNVVFWEVKLVTDSRIRCADEVIPNLKPEVLKQLNDYRKFLAVADHSKAVSDAYKNTADILVRLRKMANSYGPEFKLDEDIHTVASSSFGLQVNDEPRLVVANRKPEATH